MHIEADLDEIHASKLLILQEQLQKPLSEIVREILVKAIDASVNDQETEGQKMLRIFSDEGLIASLHGDGNLSVDYKQHLWGDK
jgi:hypothetical protein